MEQASDVAKTMPSEQPKQQPSARMAYVPKPGYVWNPFRKWPSNLYCFCGSGKKFKKCHMNNIPAAIPADQEKAVKEYITRNIKYIEMLKAKGIVYKVEEKKKEETAQPAQLAQEQQPTQEQQPNAAE